MSQREEVERFFDDAAVEGEPHEEVSPSGRYRLAIRNYRTGAHTWGYSRGTVIRIADGATVCDIKRNFSFHHSFVTKGDREYLITGRSYTSQTIVDLDRGQEYEPDGDHGGGAAFCWVTCFLSPDGNTLAVDGCVWACPYELRFFDFTDPARGWPSLPIAGSLSLDEPSDISLPRWLDARTIECHQIDRSSVPQQRTRLERRGDEMVIVEHWISEPELARRDAAARANAELDAWWAAFRTTDKMYLRLVELVHAHQIPGDTLDWRPGAHRIVQYFRRAVPRASADLHWDLDARTIAVQLYDANGNRDRRLAFSHALDGIEAAVDAISRVFRAIE